ncbi:MAG: ubiquinol-cytochrome c reductase iron-sulfur subunit [Deltaproteobacteria bacterium]|nr:ubiquinol-cytochrome c reductase iron-sulfur subunit [Deltaproteobacteria bacterium]
MSSSRRDFLLGAGCLFAAGTRLTACTPSAPRVQFLEVRLAELPAQGGKVVSFNGVPVDVRRGPDGGVVAFSLICTHQGCTVAWSEKDLAFVCPCHGGSYSADGNPLRQPPVRPLFRVPARLDGDRVILGS